MKKYSLGVGLGVTLLVSCLSFGVLLPCIEQVILAHLAEPANSVLPAAALILELHSRAITTDARVALNGGSARLACEVREVRL